MEEIFTQIKSALSCKLYYSALFMTATIPDICSAILSENNRTTGEKYKNWFNKYMSKLAPNKYGIEGQLKAEVYISYVVHYYIRVKLTTKAITNACY